MTKEGSTVVAGKIRWRREIHLRRQVLDLDWVRSASEEIATRVIHSPEFREARVILCYWAMPAEVQTDTVIHNAWAAGKRVCVPASDGAGHYIPVWCEETSLLIGGRWNIKEPADRRPVTGTPVDVALVPGVAFDRKGVRVGHGAGFFDRLLALPECQQAFKIGLAFDFQVASQPIPVQTHDVAMHALVTEKKFIRCPHEGGSTGVKQE